MKKLIKEFPNAKYYNEGKKDILNQKVLTRYYIDFNGLETQDGYLYERSKKEINRLKKEYGKNVGVNEYIECTLEVQ
ncbi:MAG: hypothetical protein E6356_13710 [Terrisporobacter othiniensis]|nr:hypothetical protein [Terrisporobacter othiniensis]